MTDVVHLGSFHRYFDKLFLECLLYNRNITVFLEMELEPSERQNPLERDKIKTNLHCGELEMTISRKRGFCLPSVVEKIWPPVCLLLCPFPFF